MWEECRSYSYGVTWPSGVGTPCVGGAVALTDVTRAEFLRLNIEIGMTTTQDH